MARYRANVTFGPWHVGDVFESDDPLHENYAEPESGVLTRLGASIYDEGPVEDESEDETAGSPPPVDHGMLTWGES